MINLPYWLAWLQWIKWKNIANTLPFFSLWHINQNSSDKVMLPAYSPHIPHMSQRHMLPKEKVYVGNMIDTIPQRWHEGRGIVQAGRKGDVGRIWVRLW